MHYCNTTNWADESYPLIFKKVNDASEIHKKIKSLQSE